MIPAGISLLQSSAEAADFCTETVPLPEGFKARSAIAGLDRMLQERQMEDGRVEVWQGDPVIFRLYMAEQGLQALPDNPILYAAIDGVRADQPENKKPILDMLQEVRENHCVPGTQAEEVILHADVWILDRIYATTEARNITVAKPGQKGTVDFFGYMKREYPHDSILHKTDLLPARFYDLEVLNDDGTFKLDYLRAHELT